jgi:hypothetical protein
MCQVLGLNPSNAKQKQNKTRRESEGNEESMERVANSSRFLAGTSWEAPSC